MRKDDTATPAATTRRDSGVERAQVARYDNAINAVYDDRKAPPGGQPGHRETFTNSL
jgi:hypothetical protein